MTGGISAQDYTVLDNLEIPNLMPTLGMLIQYLMFATGMRLQVYGPGYAQFMIIIRRILLSLAYTVG